LNTNFVDHIKIYCRSGKGGAGSVHFHREKYIAKGGPDGGDGGKGGDIVVVGNRNLWTLLHLRYTRHVQYTVTKQNPHDPLFEPGKSRGTRHIPPMIPSKTRKGRSKRPGTDTKSCSKTILESRE